MKLTVRLKYEGSIRELINKYSTLQFLENKSFKKSPNLEWLRTTQNRKEYYLQVIFLGKAGYGKSTILNQIIGKKIFDTSDIWACTRECQSAIFRLIDNDNTYYLSLGDLPGLGESKNLDEKYIQIYSKFLRKTNVVVYILRADQRDYSIDEWAFKRLFSSIEKREKIIIGLNVIDKIEPVNRSMIFKPSTLQLQNIDKKIRIISNKFGILPEQIIFFSAMENYNVDLLIRKIAFFIKKAERVSN